MTETQKHTDRDESVSPVIGSFLRSWNDSLQSDKDRTRLLKPFVSRVIGSKGSSALERRRALMCDDWFIRFHAPAWLDLAGHSSQASALRALPPIVTVDDLRASMDALRAAEKEASAARSAAESAAWSTARSAAWSTASSAARSAAWSTASSAASSAASIAAWSAAWSAARVAAWSAASSAASIAARSAAWSTASSAARSAAWSTASIAARSAAWSAAWSSTDEKLKSVVLVLQDSAVDLVNRMLEARES